MKQYTIDRKRAAVEVYNYAKRQRKEFGSQFPKPVSLASVAAGGASDREIYRWLNEDFSDSHEDHRGRDPILNEDLESLLVGFAVSNRLSFEPLSLSSLQDFCLSHLKRKLSFSTISRIMNRHGITSQRTLSRNSRMVSEDVVEEALAFIELVRSHRFPPHRIIAMDETGLWSNVSSPKTYHFKNWCVPPISLIFDLEGGFSYSLLELQTVATPHYSAAEPFHLDII